MIFFLAYLLIGCLGGFIIGFIGTGSSLFILPVLEFILSNHWMNPSIRAESLKLSIGTCISVLAVGSVVSAYTNIKKGNWDKSVFKLVLPAVILGSIIAPRISMLLPERILRYYIAALIISIVIVKLIPRKKSAQTQNNDKHRNIKLLLIGFLASLTSGVAGVALGILLIPYLNKYIDHYKSVGTNIVLASLYASITSIGYILSGWSQHIAFAIGYVYLPACILISLAMALTVPVGVKIASKLEVKKMKLIFYCFLFLSGILILL